MRETWGKVFPVVSVKVNRLPKAQSIAIVDDEEAIRDALSDLLLVVDLSCRTFDRAEALLAEYEPGMFGCIITDLKMPGIGGLELLRRLRGLDASVPVIIITSDTDQMTRSRAFEAGADAYLTKPVVSHVLLGHLGSVLGLDDLLGDDGKRKGAPDD